ncbi:hypothetical protein EDD86DRAFT_255692 [Gorgonomyces haynaldii]|nr:hypothetical protein EDD86DRAFT_255692 [Gorgonomyces haynaldii]
MSSDLEDFNEQINELINGIQTVLDKEMPRLKGAERTEKCQYLRNRINRGKQVHRSILAEIRGLQGSEKTEWEKKAKGYEERLGKLSQDVEWAETTNQDKEQTKKKTIDEMTAIDMTRQALQTQEQTQQATGRAKKALEETLQIAGQVQLEVKKQGEKINEIEEGLEQVESNLKRADKQMRIFLRRLAGDKIFLLMIMLIVVGIVLAIAFSILKKQCPPSVQPCPLFDPRALQWQNLIIKDNLCGFSFHSHFHLFLFAFLSFPRRMQLLFLLLFFLLLLFLFLCLDDVVGVLAILFLPEPRVNLETCDVLSDPFCSSSVVLSLPVRSLMTHHCTDPHL